MPARILQLAVVLLLIVVSSTADARPRGLHPKSAAWVRAAVKVQQAAPQFELPVVQTPVAPVQSWVERGIQSSGGVTSGAVKMRNSTESQFAVDASPSHQDGFAPVGQLAANGMEPISRISTEVVQFRPVSATGQVLAVPEPSSVLALATFATAVLGLSYKRKRKPIS